ncbi:MAG: hypothetical protein IKS97_02535, partial [Fibrobacter sp.]|nr:hypothetical protein [Fibrobacter sp.]
MVINKITKLSVAVAVFGLGIFAACSDDNVASSFSETNSGKPIAEWAASYIPGQIKEDSPIGLCKSQAESAVEKDEVVVDTGDVKISSTINCVTVLGFTMKTRVQVVDG